MSHLPLRQVCAHFFNHVLLSQIFFATKRNIQINHMKQLLEILLKLSELNILPSREPVDSRPVQLQVPSSLSGACQSPHNNHEFRKPCPVSVGQHVGCHGNESAEEDGTHALAHLAVVSDDVSGEHLQELTVFLNELQLLRVLWRRGRHPCEPGLEPGRFNAGQLGQRAAQTQQAGVWALLSWKQKEIYVKNIILPELHLNLSYYNLMCWTHSVGKAL